MDIPRTERVRRRRRLRLAAAAGGVAVLAAAALGVTRLKPAAPEVDASAVVIDTVRRGSILRQVRGSGSLVPVQVNWIASSADARVAKVVTEAGTVVRADTTLLELADPAQVQRALDARYLVAAAEAELVSLRNRLRSTALDERAAAARVKAEYEQARLRANADEEMAAKGVLPELTRKLSRNAADELKSRYALDAERLRIDELTARSELAAQEAKVAQLRAQSQLQQEQLAALRVRAGIDGVLQQVSVEVGQRVAPGTMLAKVVEPTRLKAQLRIPETQARDVSLGQPASIDTRNGVVRGRVVRIDPAAQNATVTVDVALEGPLPRGVRPDLTVDGTIELERMANILHSGRPVNAQEQAQGTVFRVDGDRATRVRVRFGRSSVTSIEILDGLREGDRVITSDMSAWEGFERVRLQ